MSEESLPSVFGGPVLRGRIRSEPEDFRVEEIAAFEPAGSGEHLLLEVEKRGMNTVFAARRIARWAGVAESAVGYAGLKDRHALTRQRFSVWLPKKTSPDPATLTGDGLRVLAADWHSRKLPRGALAGNRFVLRIRQVTGDHGKIESRLQAIAARGVPNYFGEQRFGRGGRNVEQARQMFDGRRFRRDQRSILLSAARSEIFNAVLAGRVLAGDWDQPRPGDVFMLEGSQSVFGPVPVDAGIEARIADFDIHPTGPMWGRGTLRTTDAVAEAERTVADAHADLCAGLEAAGLKQERRALRLPVRGAEWAWLPPDVLEVAFRLPPGAYATVVLKELGMLDSAAGDQALNGA